jgi:hypothetical protein
MADSKKSQMDTIRAKAKMIGLDVDVFVNELTDSVINQITPLLKVPDARAIAETVTLQVESKLATKVAELMDSIHNLAASQGSNAPMDIKAVVDGTAKVLEPIITKLITDQSQKAAAAVFQANSKVFMDAVKTEIESHLPASGGENTENSNVNKGNHGVAAGSVLKELLAMALSNAEGLETLVRIFRPSPPAESQIGNQLSTIFRWHGLLNKIEKGGMSSEELSKEIAGQFPSK